MSLFLLAFNFIHMQFTKGLVEIQSDFQLYKDVGCLRPWISLERHLVTAVSCIFLMDVAES